MSKSMVFGYLFCAILIVMISITAFWLLLPRFLENPKFAVLLSNGPIQIRNYEGMISALVNTQGERYEGLRSGFIPLARYIGAKDREGGKISMTAPVMQQMNAQTNSWEISFLMPSKYSLDQLPVATNKDINLYTIPPKQMAVISFNGVANKDLLNKKFLELDLWIEKSNFQIVGNAEPIYAYYNDPSTPGVFRKNEIMLPVSKKK